MRSTHCFVSLYDAERTCPMAIDEINPATGRSWINGETQEQIALRYPNVVTMTWDEYSEKHDAAMISDPSEITKDKFIEMLEVLPPMNWESSVGAQSFKMSEFTSGSITGIYCQIGKKYYSFSGDFRMTHAEIVAKCKATNTNRR